LGNFPRGLWFWLLKSKSRSGENFYSISWSLWVWWYTSCGGLERVAKTLRGQLRSRDESPDWFWQFADIAYHNETQRCAFFWKIFDRLSIASLRFGIWCCVLDCVLQRGEHLLNSTSRGIHCGLQRGSWGPKCIPYCLQHQNNLWIWCMIYALLNTIYIVSFMWFSFPPINYKKFPRKENKLN